MPEHFSPFTFPKFLRREDTLTCRLQGGRRCIRLLKWNQMLNEWVAILKRKKQLGFDRHKNSFIDIFQPRNINQKNERNGKRWKNVQYVNNNDGTKKHKHIDIIALLCNQCKYNG